MREFTPQNWMFVILITCLVGSCYQEASCQELDDNTRLFNKLSEVMQVDPPQKVTVDIVEPKKLIDWYRGWTFSQCTRGLPFHPIVVSLCGKQSQSWNGFIYGRWIQEKDPTHLHIQIVGVNGVAGAGIDTIIHEWVHWYLFYSTEPNGISNTEELTRLLTIQLLTSKEMVDWLDD